MKTDSEIRKSVENELSLDPSVDANHIAVTVNSGIVVLAGFVRTYMQKVYAERDAVRVVGKRSVANDIEVRLPFINKRPDPEIAREAIEKLKMEVPYSSQFIKVTVRDGWLTLEGTLEWKYQRDRAANAMRAMCGVIGVSNDIILKPAAASDGIRRKIEEALKRSVELDAKQITLRSAGVKAALVGSLRSWAKPGGTERAT